MGDDFLLNIGCDSLVQHSRGCAFIDIQSRNLETAKPAVNHDIIYPPELPGHALDNAQIF